MEFSAVILAGGESSRMGRDKTWVEYDGKPLGQLAVEKMRQLGIQEILISGRAGEDYSALKCRVLHDLEPGFGPLGGIERALHECTAPLLLVLAVDLPQMTAAFLEKLRMRCDRLTGVVPRQGEKVEPLAAIYPKRCHAFAFAAIAKAQHSVCDFVSACQRERAVRMLPVSRADAGCFANWNRPADMRGASRSLSAG
jgi:molybdopterin-guanine dinucleotide biosynthesis protein A